MGQNLGADAVSEFTVLTTNYSTEYGRSSGGVISAITRSGTNQFHGSAYEFLRNSALDARNFFDGTSIPEFRRNQFGVSGGGPIRKEKTFIFADYEGSRQALGLSMLQQVPSPAARGIGTGPGGTMGPSTLCSISNGDPNNPCMTQTLSSFAAQNNLTTTNPDPMTGIDKGVLPYLPFYPLPNAGLIGSGDTGSFRFSGSQVTSDNYFTTRVDHRFSTKDSIAGNYLYDNSPSATPDEFRNKTILSRVKRQVVSLEETHLFSGSLVNTLRIGYSRINAASPSGADAVNPLAADKSLFFLPGGTSGGILSVPGLTDFSGGLSTASPAAFHWNSYQLYDNLFITKGIHSLKFGGNVERIQDIETGCGNCGGNFKFNSLAELLTNNPASIIAQLNPITDDTREILFGAYVQDDIRFRSNLTINAGLRYEMATVPHEAHGQVASLHSLDGSQMFSGNPVLHNPSLLNFEPRVGFSWDPFRTGKTAIRAGFGMFDVQILPSNLRSGIGAYPFTKSLNAGNLAPGSFPSQGLAALQALPPNDTTAQRGTYIEQNPKRNYVMQWNVNIQREIAPNTTAMIAYVGSRSVHNLLVTDDSSIVLPAAKTPQGYLWPIPNTSPVPSNNGGVCLDGSTPGPLCPWPVLNRNWGRVSSQVWGSDASFHALEVQLSKRMSHGLEAQVSYTFGRSVDSSSGSTDGDQFSNGLSSLFFFDPAARRGPSDFNVPHNLIASYTWEIPSPKHALGILGWATSGWELGGIFTASSGAPLTPLIAADPLGLNNTDPFDFPNLVPGCNPVHGGVNYINVNCYALPIQTASLAGQCVPFSNAPPPPAQVTCANLLGNAGRNSLVGPRLINFDTSIFKNNHIKRISETFNAQFRVEIFNVFNHANFNPPTANNVIFDNTGAPQPGAGQVTSTATTSRQIQFALKLSW